MAVIGRRSDGSALEKRLTKRTHRLYLHNERLVTVDLAALGAASGLADLQLSNNPIERLDLEPLARSCPDLYSLSLQAREPIDLLPLALLTRLQHLTLHCETWPALDLSPLAGLPLKRFHVYGGRFAALDLSPLAGCTTLEGFGIARAAIQQIDLSPLAALGRIDQLYVQDCAAVREVDLRVCAGWPRLQRLHVTTCPVTELDLAPLSECRELTFLILVRLHLTELDVTPTAALPRFKELNVMPAEGRVAPALTLSGSRDAVRAPAIKQYLGFGLVMRAGVPAEVLGALSWSYGSRTWTSPQDLSDALEARQREIRGDAGRWSPEARVLVVPRIEIVWEDSSSSDDPAVARIASADGGGLTALDLMWGIEQAFGARIGTRDHRFFEGLRLRRKTAWDPIPCYDLALGS